MKKLILPALIASAVVAAQASTIIADGHVDIGIGYELGGFNLHVHQEEPISIEYTPDEVTFLIGPASAATSPGGAFTGFLGPAGSSVWILPSVENPALPFLGFGTEELDSSEWLGSIQLTLKAVDGPGSFAIWSVGAFGTPELKLSSADGISGSDQLPLIAGSHSHFNLGFTAPGLYEVTFEASGTHATDGVRTSDPATYRFEVVPEPSTWMLLGLGTAGLIVVARSRSQRKLRSA